MGIKFICPHCGKGLNVKSNLAGRRALCPHCKGRVEIPAADSSAQPIPVARAAVTPSPTASTQPPSTKRHSPVTGAFEDLDPNSFLLDRPVVDLEPTQQSHFDWIADAPEAVWHVRNRAGGQYGPAVGAIMRTWLQEGRVSRECYVWREGWAHWRQAGDVFPHWFEPRTNGAAPTPVAPAAAWHPTRRPEPPAPTPAPTQAPMPRPASLVSTATLATSSETQPALSSPSRRNSATWLFVAILAMVLTLSGVAITGVVYMIKKNNEVKPPNASAPPVEIRDPFS